MAGGRRVSPAELLALQGEQERIRNVCIIAHVDHGKTTLSDSLVSSNGIISAKLAGKLRFLDSTEEEQQRGITMKSSAISLLHTKEERKGRLKQQQGQQPRTGEAEGGGTASEGAAPPLPPPPPTQTNGSAQPPKAEGGGGGPAVEVEVKDYLINLIDSPGHIDFSSDVSTATRLSDGAIVVVDVLEGVCTQTHAVLRQAWAERMKPCLVLNKLDRLILELRLTPLEAYWHLQRVLERLNAISSSLITNETFRLDETEDFADDLEKEWLFSPDRGNVVFASSLYCWAFSVGTFAKIWAKKLGLKRVLLQRHLWGDFVFNPKAQTVTRWTAESKAKPMFVAMVLDPIWQLYDTAVVTPDLDKVAKMIKRLDLEVPARELNAKDTRGTAQSIFRRWLPLADAVLDMVVEVVPDPMAAQRRRIPALWPEHQEEEMLAQQQQQDGAPPATNGHGGEEQAGGTGELLAGMASVRSSLSCCSIGPDAPVVVFVSKMISVRNAELADSPAFSHEGESFVGFARVFSGVLRPNTQMHVLGPKYHPLRRRAANHCRAVPEDTRLCLYMMMGTSLTPVPHVPAGNLVAILGLDGLVLKSATLTSTLACPALTAMTLQAKPIVRVAVEVVRQQDMAALERGLAKLYQADPAVEVSVQETGEHVIMALGELHLEQCLKDLRERYAKVELRASAPLVSFKESVATDVGAPSTGAGEDAGTPDRPPQLTLPPWSEEEGAATAAGGVCVLETASKDCRLTVRCLPLPDSLARMLEAEPTEVRVLMKSLQAERDEAVAGEGGGPSAAAAEEDLPPTLRSEAEAAMVLQRRKMSTLSQDGTDTALPFRQAVEEEWAKAWQDTRPQLAEAGLAALLAFGPRNSGPNTLVKSPAFRVRVLAVERKRKTEGQETEGRATEGEEEVEERDVPLGGEQGAKALEEKVWRCLGNSIATGFQMATASGPLAEEQVYGVCFVVEEVSLLLREGGLEGQEAVGEWLTSRLGSLTGQVMSTCKSACRAAFLSSPVRLVEALFKCDLQCDRVQLGKLYGVLSKRRGRVVEEDIIEGTDLFLIRALLPVAESFGFATELLKKTSGAATTPQLAFSHWERMELDPFWRPRNEEDREEFGESVYEVNTTRKYIDDTRRRKGLQLGEKIVIHAEKQRTLKRNK